MGSGFAALVQAIIAYGKRCPRWFIAAIVVVGIAAAVLAVHHNSRFEAEQLTATVVKSTKAPMDWRTLGGDFNNYTTVYAVEGERIALTTFGPEPEGSRQVIYRITPPQPSEDVYYDLGSPEAIGDRIGVGLSSAALGMMIAWIVFSGLYRVAFGQWAPEARRPQLASREQRRQRVR